MLKLQSFQQVVRLHMELICEHLPALPLDIQKSCGIHPGVFFEEGITAGTAALQPQGPKNQKYHQSACMPTAAHFQHRIGSHITSVQVWVGVVGVGPQGAALNSSFANRDNPAYKVHLLQALDNAVICAFLCEFRKHQDLAR